jgi:lipid-binding SYLF domain-containing protein
VFAVLALLLLPTAGWAKKSIKDAQDIVYKSKETFVSFMKDPKLVWLRQHFHQAKAVMIFPHVAKGGFIVGGTGGEGVLLVKDSKTGRWSEPAFYSLGGASLGLQIGGQVGQVVLVAMDERGVNELLNSNFKLGAGAAVAAGPMSAGATTRANVVYYSKAKGLYAGLNLEGASMSANDQLNTAYYGRKVSVGAIVLGHRVRNPSAEELRAALQQPQRR